MFISDYMREEHSQTAILIVAGATKLDGHKAIFVVVHRARGRLTENMRVN